MLMLKLTCKPLPQQNPNPNPYPALYQKPNHTLECKTLFEEVLLEQWSPEQMSYLYHQTFASNIITANILLGAIVTRSIVAGAIVTK